MENSNSFGEEPKFKPSVLPPDAVERVTLEAKKEGVFAGLTGGLVSATIAGRLMGLNRNLSLLSGVVSGVAAGYYFTQAFRDTAMAQLRAEEARLRAQPQTQTPSTNSEFAPESSSL